MQPRQPDGRFGALPSGSEVAQTFICTRCSKERALGERCAVRRSKWCRKCHSAYAIDWRRRHGKPVEKTETKQARRRRWRAANPLKSRAIRAKRRAGLQASGVTLTGEQWEAICERFNGRCAYCGEPGATMDHVIALSRGGEHSEDNVVPACSTCNSRKNNRTILSMVNVTFAVR
jgi:5-methylcytosine-specific restriction endonuclease McrA